MAFFESEQGSLHYLVRGAGEPLMLIHGLGGTGANWAFQVAALEKNFKVIVPDLPGSGHSSPPTGGYSISGFADVLWELIDELGICNINLIGFSLGGAVAFEMAARHPGRVPRLGLINSLATYRPNDWRKWMETHVTAALVRLIGMRRAAWLLALRLFPEPWQRAIREHAAAAVGSVPATCYLGAGFALARWAIVDRLDRLTSRILMIAAEKDFTPLTEKRALAALLNADIVVVRGSRHGTPFDSVTATNASLLAMLTDQPLPPQSAWQCDSHRSAEELLLPGSIAEEHAASAARAPWRKPARRPLVAVRPLAAVVRPLAAAVARPVASAPVPAAGSVLATPGAASARR